MAAWKPLYELGDPDAFEGLRRAIIAGYFYEMGTKWPKVGEAFWGSPEGNASRWIWVGGGNVVNPMAYQDLPDFPIADQNDIYAVGRPLEEQK